MMAPLSGIVEWGSYDGITGMAARCPLIFRCLGLLRLWGLVGPIVVTSGMDRQHAQVVHCLERTLPSSPSNYCIAGNFRGIQFSRFLRLTGKPRN